MLMFINHEQLHVISKLIVHKLKKPIVYYNWGQAT